MVHKIQEITCFVNKMELFQYARILEEIALDLRCMVRAQGIKTLKNLVRRKGNKSSSCTFTLYIPLEIFDY